MQDDHELVSIEVEVERHTQDALLVDDGDVTEWVPRSQISDDSTVDETGDAGEIVIPLWLARDKGFI